MKRWLFSAVAVVVALGAVGVFATFSIDGGDADGGQLPPAGGPSSSAACAPGHPNCDDTLKVSEELPLAPCAKDGGGCPDGPVVGVILEPGDSLPPATTPAGG